MLGQAVYEIEVEVAQEVWEILLDDINHSQGGVIESLNHRGSLLVGNQVVFQEYQNALY